MKPSTPCIGVCHLDGRGLCVGCGRSLEQIAAWATMDEPERRRIMLTLAPGRTAQAGTSVPDAASLDAARSLPGTASPASRAPRIVSLLPAATEMAFALGLGDAVVGVSQECDFPLAARSRPAVVRSALPVQRMSQREIDAAVSQRLSQGQSLYEVDEALLQTLQPELVLTQDLCQVCAPSGHELGDAMRRLTPEPAVLTMTPHTLADILENLQALGRATGQEAAAQQLIEQYRERLARVRAALGPQSAYRRVFVMEWAEPIYCCGHWVPEMLALAGGVDALARPGQDSVRTAWQDVQRWAPELLIVAPCGCNAQQALAQLPALMQLPGWTSLPAVARGQVFCVDGNSYLARPGPRIVQGVELLAHLLHPQRFDWTGPADAYRAPGPAVRSDRDAIMFDAP